MQTRLSFNATLMQTRFSFNATLMQTRFSFNATLMQTRFSFNATLMQTRNLKRNSNSTRYYIIATLIKNRDAHDDWIWMMMGRHANRPDNTQQLLRMLKRAQ